MTMPSSSDAGPTLAQIRSAATALRGRIIETPTVSLSSDRVAEYLPSRATVSVKLELFQHAGSFKTRGALLSLDALGSEEKRRGVTAMSAGNHALSVAWAAHRESVGAKLVMPGNADPVRINGCRSLGAEVILVDDIHSAFRMMDKIAASEGRVAIHPFDGIQPALGAATCGLEIMRQLPGLDAVVVPVGGGGLVGGIGRACKLVAPGCQVFGVEPMGADTLYQSFEKGEAVSISTINTIADSLGAPTALPYSLGVARANVDQLVRISDDEMLRAMALLYDALKIVCEPACAAATAALIGPLRDRLAGKRVAVIACGSNIAEDRYVKMLRAGRKVLNGHRQDRRRSTNQHIRSSNDYLNTT